jgi:hypothetical protein
MAGILKVVDEVFSAETEKGQSRMLHIPCARRIVIAVIRRLQAPNKRLMKVLKRPTSIGEEDASPSVGIDDFLQSIRHIIQSFIPTQPAPFPFSTAPFPDHGKLGAFVIVHKGRPGSSTGAKCPFDPRRVGVSLNERAFSILYFHLYGAAHGAHTADAVYLLLCHRYLPESLSKRSTTAIQGIFPVENRPETDSSLFHTLTNSLRNPLLLP